MELFIDSARLDEIEDALKRGFVSGITTNPALLSRLPKCDFEGHIKKIIELIDKHQKRGIHLSVEVFSKKPDEILTQAKHFVKEFQYPISVKVQIGWNELEVIHSLAKEKISGNCTACMTITQAVMAANAGAEYVSLFFNRIRDADPKILKAKLANYKTMAKKSGENKEPGFQAHLEKEITTINTHLKKSPELIEQGIVEDNDFDPVYVIQNVRKLLDAKKMNTKIISGSIRSVLDVKESMLAGAHIVTVPPAHFMNMASHYKTDESIEEFLKYFAEWQGKNE